MIHVPTQDDSRLDINLDPATPPFADSISWMDWIGSSNFLATTFWDGYVRLFQVNPNFLTLKSQLQLDVAISCASIKNDGSVLYLGCVDGSTRALDLSLGKQELLGSQTLPVSSLQWVNQMNALIGTSYDKSLKIYSPGNKQAVANLTTINKIFKSDLKFPVYLAGASRQTVALFDLNTLRSKPQVVFSESPLGKFSQIQSVALAFNKKLLALGGSDGRVNFSTIQSSGEGLTFKVKSNFKQVEIIDKQIRYVYPVNHVQFNQARPQWFVLAGADGSIKYFNHEKEKVLRQLRFSSQPVTAGRVNRTGTLMGYGLGNDWHLGVQTEKGVLKSRICVHVINN